jgi:DNA polymerase eta
MSTVCLCACNHHHHPSLRAICGSMSRFTSADLQSLQQASPAARLRVIALLDYDAFYAQVEGVRLNMQDRPLAVRQWNAIIAMNYQAKRAGLTRGVSVDEARRLCPDVHIQHVATWREGETNWAYHEDIEQYIGVDKSALDPYRIESVKSMQLIRSLLPVKPSPCVEWASIDEVFIDLSAQVYDLLIRRYPEISSLDTKRSGHLPISDVSSMDWAHDTLYPEGRDVAQHEPLDWDDVVLNIGAEIVRDIRKAILEQLNYTCSAGIARNKTLAKLGAGYRKPDGQTVIRQRFERHFLSTFKINKIRNLGGKLGHHVVEVLGTDSVAKIADLSREALESSLGRDIGCKIYYIVRGADESEVVAQTRTKSMLSQKMFVPSIERPEQAHPWLAVFANDLILRLDLRITEVGPCRPRTLTLNVHTKPRSAAYRSKQLRVPLSMKMDSTALVQLGKELLIRFADEPDCWPCVTMSMCISNFEEPLLKGRTLTSYFTTTDGDESNKHVCEDLPDLNGVFSMKRKAIEEAQTEERYPCPHCQKLVPDEDVLNHLDWHVAMEVSAND